MPYKNNLIIILSKNVRLLRGLFIGTTCATTLAVPAYPASILPTTIMDTDAKTAMPAANQSHLIVARTDEFSFFPNLDEFNQLVLKPDLSRPSTNLWFKLAALGEMTYPDHEAVHKQLQLFLREKFWAERSLKRAQPYLHFVMGELQKRQMPVELALIPLIESGYNPTARSHNKAVGLWQFVPVTAKALGLKIDNWLDERRSVERSTRAALNYFQELYQEFGDWSQSIAAYNAGPSRLRARIKKLDKADFSIWDLTLPKETHLYVAKFFALNELISHAEKYQIDLPHIEEKNHFVRVDAKQRISLQVAAEFADVPNNLLETLNNELISKGTPPDGPHSLLIPADAANRFLIRLTKALDNSEKTFRPTIYHTIKPGETLGHIARDYNTSISELKRLNQLTDSHIKSGQQLLVAKYRQKKESNKNKKHPEYKVQEGDTLSEIAQFYGVKRSLIASTNKIDDDNRLRAGKILIIPAKYIPAEKSMLKYTVKKGDTLSEIARQFNVSLKDLRKVNPPLAEAHNILPGQKVFVPTSSF